MDLYRLVLFVRKKIWLLMLFMLIGGISAAVCESFTSKIVYKAETSLYVIGNNDVYLSTNDVQLGRELIGDFKSLLLSRRVLMPVINEINKDISYTDLSKAVTVDYKDDSNLVSMIVVWPDINQVVDIANKVSRSFKTQAEFIMGGQVVNLIDDAVRPKKPVPSNRLLYILIGTFSGAFLALAAIYIIELNDTTIFYPEELEDSLGLDVLAVIPRHSLK